MKVRASAAVWLLIAVLTVPAADARGSSWRVETAVSGIAGETSYRLFARAEDPASPGTTTEIRSELDFPLDAFLVGLAVQWDALEETEHPWTFRAGASMGVTDSGTLMTDQDWVGDAQIAYTESESEMNLLLLTAETRYGLLERGRVGLSLLARVDYEAISQDIIGFDGWVVEQDTGVQHEISGDAPVIDYDVTYITPQFGVRSTVELAENVGLALECAAGLAFASDKVDHLLRGKASDGSAVGGSLYSRAELSITPGPLLGGRASVDLIGEVRYISAKGSQTQRWYKDDGSTPAGTKVTGIPHEFRSRQYTLGLRISIAL